MSNLLILLKNRFRITFGIDKLKKTKKIILILYALLGIYVIASVSFSMGFYAEAAADILIKYNMLPYMLLIFFVMAAFATFMFTTYSSKANLFDSKDNTLLFSLPIRSRNIFTSRFISIVISNLLITILLMIPAIFVYVTRTDVGISFYLFMFVILLFIAVIPTILASIVGYVIAYLTSKVNVKSLFEILFSFIFIFGIYALIYNGEKILNLFTENKELIDNILKYGLYPLYLIIKMVMESSFSALIQYVLINVGLLVLFVYLFSIKFKSIISKLQESRAKSNYVMKELKTSSSIKSLFKKEVKRYLSSPIYVMNTVFGVVILLVMAIASVFYSTDQILSTIGFEQVGLSMFSMLIVLYCFISFLSSTTSASISIEGNNFWLMKSLPIKYKDLLTVKLLLNLLIVLPISYISIIIFKFTLDLSIIQALLLMLLTTIFSISASQFGLLVNLKFPKMDAINDVVIVKRSLSVLISILVPMVLVMVLTTLYIQFQEGINNNLILIIITSVFVAVSVLENILLNKYGINRIKSIEV